MSGFADQAHKVRPAIGPVGMWVSGAATGGPAGAASLARRAEEIGVRALWVGGGNRDANALDERAAMLAATADLVVATGIVNIWAWDPSDLISRASAISVRYPGRFLLGLGVAHEPLVSALGRKYEHPVATMRAFLDELDGLVGGERVGGAIGAGERVGGAIGAGERVGGAIGGGDGVGGGGGASRDEAPPRVLAALGPTMLGIARERAAGAHPYLVTPEHTATARKVLGEGRLLAPEQAVVVGRTAGESRAIAREFLANYLALPNYLANLRRLGFDGPDFTDGGSDRLVDALVAWGDVAAVSRRLGEHLDAGADHVCVQPLAEGRAVDFGAMESLMAQQ